MKTAKRPDIVGLQSLIPSLAVAPPCCLVTQYQRDSLMRFKLTIIQKRDLPLLVQHHFDYLIYRIVYNIWPGGIIRRR